MDYNEEERRGFIQSLNDRVTIAEAMAAKPVIDDRPMSAVVLITVGCVLGLLIMFAAQSCDREPMPAVVKTITGDIHCQYCHGVKLNNQKRYAKYWKARKSVDHTQLVSAKDDAEENERMMRLIVGGKP